MAAKMDPQFAPGQDMSNVSPEDVAEAKRRAKATAAFNKESGTPPAPKASEPVKKAKGGYVKSADGCVSKGKTRGRMV